MQSLSRVDPNATLTRGHRFVVTLTAQEGKPVEVRSCEVIGTFHRNRFTFPTAISIDDVFIDDVATGVARCMGSLSNTTEVVSLPTMTIEIPGLTLARAHLITTKSEDGSLNVILRFKVLLGAVTQAFRPELGIEDSIPDHSAHMSALVLTDIVMPLLDICTAAEEGGLTSTAGVDNFMDTLIARSSDVRFQAELIKRYVASAPDAPTRTPQSQLTDARSDQILPPD